VRYLFRVSRGCFASRRDDSRFREGPTLGNVHIVVKVRTPNQQWKGLLLAVVSIVAVSCAPAGTNPLTFQIEGGIRAYESDEVWLFEHASETGDDALHGGTPVIVGRCLYVDDAIVVWHAEGPDAAEAAVAAARAGTNVVLSIPGGGLSTAEGADPDDLPNIITERCDTTAVWFAAP